MVSCGFFGFVRLFFFQSKSQNFNWLTRPYITLDLLMAIFLPPPVMFQSYTLLLSFLASLRSRLSLSAFPTLWARFFLGPSLHSLLTVLFPDIQVAYPSLLSGLFQMTHSRRSLLTTFIKLPPFYSFLFCFSPSPVTSLYTNSLHLFFPSPTRHVWD